MVVTRQDKVKGRAVVEIVAEIVAETMVETGAATVVEKEKTVMVTSVQVALKRNMISV